MGYAVPTVPRWKFERQRASKRRTIFRAVTPKLRSDSPAARNNKTVRVSRGEVSITVDANIMKMSKVDREFVFGMVDAMNAYEASK